MRSPFPVVSGLALLAVLFTCPVQAQESGRLAGFNPRFELFTLPGEDGSNNIQCIVQDSTGFVWFASMKGLHRFDGQYVLTYRHDPKDPFSIASDYIEWICAGHDGILWLGHAEHGVSAFDPRTEKCVRYSREADTHNKRLTDNHVSVIVEDTAGYIWVGTPEGLDRLDRRRDTITHFDQKNGLSYNLVRSLYVDRRGTLWVGCGTPFDFNDSKGQRGGLNRYNPDGTFTPYVHDPSKPNSLSNNQVRAIFEDSRGQFWVGTSGAGLHRMDRNSGAFTCLPFDPAHPTRLGSPVLQRNAPRFPPFYHVGFISEDQDGRLWIGAIEGGLNVYDPKDGAMRHFEMAEGMTDSLQTNYLWHFCQTRDGVVWLASAGLGGKVFRVRNCNSLFPFYGPRQLGTSSAMIPGILKDPDGKIWLQLRDGFNGVALYDRNTASLKRLAYDPPMDTMAFLDFEDLGIDRKGNIWASTPKGLYRLDRSRMSGRNPSFVRDTTACGNNAFTLLWLPFFDKQGNTWTPAFGDGLYLQDTLQQRHHFTHDPANARSISDNLVLSVFQDKRGRIWVQGGSTFGDRTSPMFFDLFEPSPQGGGAFTHFLPPGETGSPGCTVEDDSGHFWFIAFPFGIRKLNPDTREYKTFNVANSKLPTDAVTSMVKARDGTIWMTGNNFIIELDPVTESFYTYTTHHGVQNLSWVWITGYSQGADGEVLFSGDGGFHTFYPEHVSRITHKSVPQIRLTSLSVLGSPVTPERSSLLNVPVWEAREIRLPYRQNHFSFHVSIFDFYGADLTRLEYTLENYDRGWRNDLREGEATYVNVPPGDYIFRVRGMNNIGIRAPEFTFHVVIQPPWWRSWWAYVCWTMLIAGALYAFYRLQLNKKLEHAETVRLRELDAVKTKLYTNITHEFRTPLTLLIGPAERLLEKNHLDGEIRSVMQIIRRNGLRLLTLVNQMLDLSKLDDGKITLHFVHGDVVGYIRYVAEAFETLAKDRNIRLQFQSDLEMLEMDFDEERLQQIVSNLLSNALKFTDGGGEVYIHVGRRSGRNVEHHDRNTGTLSCLLISIRDTGIGIPEDKLPYIFDRFYQVDDSSSRTGESTGIGLTLTKELVKLMHGEIEVKSRPGWGTEFTVVLPIRRESTELASFTHIMDGKAGHLHEPYVPAPDQHNEGFLPEPANNQAPLILLVEDNPDVIAYLASCLGDYRLLAAKDGREGLDIALDTVPDIIISDVMMPRMDGYELCRLLKADLRTSHIPVILLTAKADVDSRLQGLEHGADVYLTKPFYRKELLIRVRKLLESRRQLQSHYQQIAGFGDSTIPVKNLSPASEQENAFVKKARETVEAHLDDPQFDVVKFCREMAMSHSHAHRKLSALTGYSATYFVRHVRLNKAKELLQQPDISITAIAFDCGFNDPAYFSRVFKQAFGMTPIEWRERHHPTQ